MTVREVKVEDKLSDPDKPVKGKSILGNYMRDPKEKALKPLPRYLNFSPPDLDENELSEIASALRSGWITQGPKTESFENSMAAFLKAGSALAVSSCTAALHLALRVLEIGEGDGVISTPLTFVSTIHAVVYTGARPFFCDVDPANGNLDPAKVREFLEKDCRKNLQGEIVHVKSGKRIKAILPVHYGGFPVDLEAFYQIANEHKLHLLEDAAHALGSAYGGHPIGSDPLRERLEKGLKSLTAFSFYATKNLTTGEGGLLTGPEDLIDKARVLSAYGISDARRIWGRYTSRGTWEYDVRDLGFKNNFTDIQAAMGLAQLMKFQAMQNKRLNFALLYNKALSPLNDLVVLPRPEAGTTPSWHLYPLRLNLRYLDIDRDLFIERLKHYNVGCSVMFIPVHTFTYYRKLLGMDFGFFPAAEQFFLSVICLPISPKNPQNLTLRAAKLIHDLIKVHAVKEKE
ncbi:MAG: DegT/DnrJ/EryC1/StrS aminotransferase family protein [Deltaproteobacteria bacterium]|jgi:dTDP-4-amino-4,6-dideoxygalactose transaminase|nr:DegT/DnrJ/EryC1/StrS aminotransferase family protein [Deltaproteobacteria bacterium]